MASEFGVDSYAVDAAVADDGFVNELADLLWQIEESEWCVW